jgi:hypothetical protein
MFAFVAPHRLCVMLYSYELIVILLFRLLNSQEREVKFFTETEENNQMRGPRTAVPYFL